MKDVRRVTDVRATVVGAPTFIVGKNSMSVHHVSIIYRLQSDSTAWEFIHVTLTGTWLDGQQQGKSAYRKYGRSTLNRVPDWLIILIDSHAPRDGNHG